MCIDCLPQERFTRLMNSTSTSVKSRTTGINDKESRRIKLGPDFPGFWGCQLELGRREMPAIRELAVTEWGGSAIQGQMLFAAKCSARGAQRLTLAARGNYNW